MKNKKEIYGDFSIFNEIGENIPGNIIVGILDMMTPGKSKNARDFYTTFRAVDMTGQIEYVRAFSSDENFIYGNYRRGNIVKILDVKKFNRPDGSRNFVMSRENKIQLIYDFQSLKPAFDLSKIDREIVDKVVVHMRSGNKDSRRKDRRIEELHENLFFDFRGKLIEKIEEENSYGLFFIDGTKNLIFGSSDLIFDFPSNMILFVKIWRKEVGDSLKVSRFYQLKNLHITRIGPRLEANYSEFNKEPIVQLGRIDNYINMVWEGIPESIYRSSIDDLQPGFNYLPVMFYGRTQISSYTVCMTHRKIYGVGCMTPCSLLEVKCGNIAVGDGNRHIICTYKEPLISKIDILVCECQYPMLIYMEGCKYFVVDVLGN